MKRRTQRGLLYVLVAASTACGAYVKYDESRDRGMSTNLDVDAGDLGVDLVSEGSFDHRLLDGLLREHVKVDGAQTLLDYVAIEQSPTAQAALESYRAALATIDPSALAGTNEKLAFWLNAYNASVIAGVIEKRKANPGFAVSDDAFVFFDERVFRIAGAAISLDELEQGVIRGDFENDAVKGSANEAKLRAWFSDLWQGAEVDPRIHVALNCAALSCPNLQTRSWQVETLEADLQRALEAFLADPAKGAGPDGISMLFTFYQADFELEGGSVGAFIEKNRKGGLEGVAVDKRLDYDWSLNITP